ncbi:MAG: hypothetical protein WBE69_06245 [Candidatus Binataceae bacterium]
MEEVESNRTGRTMGRAVLCVAAALLFAMAIAVSSPAEAARGGGFGGAGFHGGLGGGGFHGGIGGFHGGVDFHGGAGGFHGGGFHAGRLAMGGSRGGAGHGGVANLHDGFGFGARDGGHWAYGWYNGRYGWWRGDGLGWTYYPYPYDADYGDYSLPAAAPYWYCSDPPGYYPYLTQCNTAWQTAPGS